MCRASARPSWPPCVTSLSSASPVRPTRLPPLGWLAASFAAGVAFQPWVSDTAAPYLAAGLAFAALPALAWALLSADRRRGRAALLAAALIAGLAYAAARAILPADAVGRLAGGGPDYRGEFVVLDGTVASEPAGTPPRAFLLQVGSAHGRPVHGLVRVTEPEPAQGEPPPPLPYGQPVRLEGMLALPRPPGNPGEFDYAAYLRHQGVQAVLRARRLTALPGPSGGWPPIRLALAARRSMEKVLAAALPGPDAALLGGLLLGGASDLDPQVAQDFRVAGLYHVLAVSGSNVAFVALPVLAALTLWLGRRPALAATAAVVVAYVLVTGATPSVLRAGIMAVAVLAGEALGRGGNGLASLAAAALFLLVQNPGTLRDPGFQLSFAATAGILTLTPGLQAGLSRLPRLPEWVRSPLAITVAAQLGVLPLSLAFWQGVSLISLAANLVAAPLVEALVWLGSALVLLGEASAPLAGWLSGPVRLTLAVLTRSMHLLAAVPLAYLTVPAPGALQVLAYYAALTLAAARPRLPPRLLWATAAVVLSLAVAPLWRHPGPGGLEVVFLDVGQGDATLVRLPEGKTMLVDGGGWQDGAASAGWDPGAQVVVPFLRRQGVRRIDVVVATHPHADHVGGLSAVIRSLPVGEVWLGAPPGGPSEFDAYRTFLKNVAALGTRTRYVQRGQELRLGPLGILVLGPPARPYTGQRSDENANSIILKLTYGRSAVVLVGDAEAPVERDLLADPALGPRLAGVSVLKAGHHGSRYASSSAWVEGLQPAVAVVSVGRNSFGHPAAETLQVLREAGGGRPVLRTDWDGAILFHSDGRREEIRTVRSAVRWRRPAGTGRWEAAEGRPLRDEAAAPGRGEVAAGTLSKSAYSGEAREGFPGPTRILAGNLPPKGGRSRVQGSGGGRRAHHSAASGHHSGGARHRGDHRDRRRGGPGTGAPEPPGPHFAGHFHAPPGRPPGGGRVACG